MLSRATPVTFEQDIPSDTWVVDHKLGDVATVNVVIEIDNERHSILPNDITHLPNQTTIKFTRPYRGTARLV